MNAAELLEQARDTMTAKRVFSDPYEKNGVTVITAAGISGGGGAGAGETPGGQGQGSGGGFGVNARPVGAFVIKGDQVAWQPRDRRQPRDSRRPDRGHRRAADAPGGGPNAVETSEPQIERPAKDVSERS